MAEYKRGGKDGKDGKDGRDGKDGKANYEKSSSRAKRGTYLTAFEACSVGPSVASLPRDEEVALQLSLPVLPDLPVLPVYPLRACRTCLTARATASPASAPPASRAGATSWLNT